MVEVKEASERRIATIEHEMNKRIIESVNATFRDIFGIRGYGIRYMPGARVVDQLGNEVEGGFVCKSKGEYCKVEKNGERISLAPYHVYVTADMRENLEPIVIAAEEVIELHIDRVHASMVKLVAWMFKRLGKAEAAQWILSKAKMKWAKVVADVYQRRHIGMGVICPCVLSGVIIPVTEERCHRKAEHRKEAAERAIDHGTPVMHGGRRTPEDVIEFEKLGAPYVILTFTKIKVMLKEKIEKLRNEFAAPKTKSEADDST